MVYYIFLNLYNQMYIHLNFKLIKSHAGFHYIKHLLGDIHSMSDTTAAAGNTGSC